MERKIFDFLSLLRENNNREWFTANKALYEESLDVFRGFVNRLIPEIRDFDDTIDLITANDCLFRIYRDVRFSRNKDPYKTNIGAYVARGGRKSGNAGYYIHLEPGQSFLAGGMYMPEPEMLKRIREEIYYNYEEFTGILNDPGFKEYFPEFIDTGKLSRPPKGYDAGWHGIEMLKYKSYAVANNVGDDQVLADDFFQYTVSVFRQLHKLNKFLNRVTGNN